MEAPMGEYRVVCGLATFSCMAAGMEEATARLCGLLRVDDDMVVARISSGCNLLRVAGEGRETCSNSMLLGFLGTKGGGPLLMPVSWDVARWKKLDFLVEAPAKLLRRFGDGGFVIKSGLVSSTGCLCRISGGGGGNGSSKRLVSISKPGGGGGRSGEGTRRLGFLGGRSGTQPSCAGGGTGGACDAPVR